jgi:hypothetical protein
MTNEKLDLSKWNSAVQNYSTVSETLITKKVASLEQDRKTGKLTDQEYFDKLQPLIAQAELLTCWKKITENNI